MVASLILFRRGFIAKLCRAARCSTARKIALEKSEGGTGGDELETEKSVQSFLRRFKCAVMELL